MIDLDDVAGLTRQDSEGVLGAVEAFPVQFAEGYARGQAAAGVPSADGVDSVVVLGMGGSASAGDVVGALIEPRAPFFYRVIKGYPPLPEWIGRNSIAVAISYSGNTEETLECFAEAHDRGARLVAICSGGALATAAASGGAALVEAPGGLQPRAALGYLAGPLLALLARTGLVPDPAADLAEARAVLEVLAARCVRDIPVEVNPAKELALALEGRVPVIYGGSPVAVAAAGRFKCDLNEYAKVPAFCNALPEMNHNEIAAWDGPAELVAGRFAPVFLRDPAEHARVARRFELTRKVIEALNPVTEVRAEGEGPVARILSLVFLTQMAAIYLGLRSGSDPGPVAVLDWIKQRLAADAPAAG